MPTSGNLSAWRALLRAAARSGGSRVSPAGQVVVTTRRRDAALRGHGRCLIYVDVFTQPEAEAYLHAALADQPHLAVGAAELGCLPLVLAQAGAYMLDRACPAPTTAPGGQTVSGTWRRCCPSPTGCPTSIEPLSQPGC